MKKLINILLTGFLAFSLVACSSSNKGEDKDTKRVAVVLSTGGLGDKNFNDMAYEGMTKAKEDFNIEFDYVEPTSASDFESAHRMFAESKKYDLIIGLASDQTDAIVAVSKDFPEQKWSFIDASLEQKNVSSVFTKWQEQTFLCGVLAGLGTLSDMEFANDSNVVGVILGMDNPNLRKGVIGFEAGVRYVNKDAQVLQGVVNNFNDPAKGKEIALSMYNKGADFVQHIAGASGLGVFNAAVESNKYAFGVGGNQNAIEPNNIVATSIRNVNEMVYNEVKALVEGTWTEGLTISGLKEGSVGYSNELSNIKLPEEIVNTIEDIRNKIVNGELVIVENEDELENWLENNQYSK